MFLKLLNMSDFFFFLLVLLPDSLKVIGQALLIFFAVVVVDLGRAHIFFIFNFFILVLNQKRGTPLVCNCFSIRCSSLAFILLRWCLSKMRLFSLREYIVLRASSMFFFR